MFVIDASSSTFYAIAALFGSIFVLFCMIHGLSGNFFRFVALLLTLAMSHSAASAFIFVRDWLGL
jgi:hypothetical protein